MYYPIRGSNPLICAKKMKLKNIILVLKDNLPMKRFLKNLLQGHIKRKFRKRSHERLDGTPNSR